MQLPIDPRISPVPSITSEVLYDCRRGPSARETTPRRGPRATRRRAGRGNRSPAGNRDAIPSSSVRGSAPGKDLGQDHKVARVRLLDEPTSGHAPSWPRDRVRCAFGWRRRSGLAQCGDSNKNCGHLRQRAGMAATPFPGSVLPRSGTENAENLITHRGIWYCASIPCIGSR